MTPDSVLSMEPQCSDESALEREPNSYSGPTMLCEAKSAAVAVVSRGRREKQSHGGKEPSSVKQVKQATNTRQSSARRRGIGSDAPGFESEEFEDGRPSRCSSRKGAENPTQEHATRHQAAEQRRRNRIKEKLDKLKTRIPSVDPRTNTACFLEAVVKYIDALQDRLGELEKKVQATTSIPHVSAFSEPPAAVPLLSLDLGGQQQQGHSHHVPFNTCIAPALFHAESSITSEGMKTKFMQMQMLQQQQQLQMQLLLQHRVGEMQREQQAASAILGLQSACEPESTDAAGCLNNSWANSLAAKGMEPRLGSMQDPITSNLKNSNSLEALEALTMLANQQSGGSVLKDEASCRKLTGPLSSGSDEEVATKRTRR